VSPILGVIASANQGQFIVYTDYESIATVTASGSTGVVTFSSIPSTYQHLQVRFIGRSASDTEVKITCNSDTGANYARHLVYGDGSTTGAGANASQSNMRIAYTTNATNPANVYAANVIDILDYANTNKYKTFRSMTGVDVNGAGGYIQLSSGLWQSTTAINSLTFTLTDNYTSLSNFALYGIKG
jgi:hypothetical protein